MKEGYLDETTISADAAKYLEELKGIDRRYYWRVKRCFDIVVSLGAVIVLSPLLFLIALVILMDDPHGSPIYKQPRVGRHGKVFMMYKFRTMVVGADVILADLQHSNEMDGPVFKIRDDPRITKFGRFLRTSSLDELMQLFNVLRGDMSIVGPRPPLIQEYETYSDFEKLRLIVTPGLTCYWQTTDRRNEVSFAEWVTMDLEYIKHRTIWLDIRLCFKTVKVMLKKEGR